MIAMKSPTDFTPLAGPYTARNSGTSGTTSSSSNSSHNGRRRLRRQRCHTPADAVINALAISLAVAIHVTAWVVMLPVRLVAYLLGPKA